MNKRGGPRRCICQLPVAVCVRLWPNNIRVLCVFPSSAVKNAVYNSDFLIYNL